MNLKSAGPAPDDLESDLLSLETRLLEPATRSDRAALENLLDDDFVEFGSSGRIFDRHSIIDALAGEAPCERRISGFRVLRLAEDAALVTYRLSWGPPGASSDSLRSSVWKRVNGAWKMTFHQGTRCG